MPGFEVLGEEEKKEILDVLERGVLFRYGFDEQRKGVYKVASFEKAFAEMCGARYALAVSSGTAALKVALAALGIGPGDEVITQGFTFVATWESIIDVGGIPVFTEIDETLCMDPNDLEKKITPKTKAVIPVHMCGAQARIGEIVAIADRHGIPVIEDTAQSCGGTLDGKYLGTFGKVGTFSFDSVKTITTGEGGMVVTDDEETYIRASEFHDHGHDHDPTVGRGQEKRRFFGMNYRMMEIQGALGLAQLGKLPDILERQRANHRQLQEAARAIRNVSFRQVPDPAGDTATFFTFFLPSKETTLKCRKILTDAGAAPIYFLENTWHYYPEWEHLLEGKSIFRTGWPFRGEAGEIRCAYKKDALPQSDSIMSRAITYPIAVYMDDQIPTIREALNKAAREL
jgi:8-amino-3,8-dideoxy-alpha-D-manno-octulosonate transaminase